MNKEFCDIVNDEATKLIAIIKERRLALIEETIKHYTSKNRGHLILTPEGGYTPTMCVYSPIEGISDGCAIGRLIVDKEVTKRMDEIRGCIDDTKLRELIPFDLLMLGTSFLANLQQLHDVARHWDEKGLSEEGQSYVESLKKEFEL